MAEVLRIMKRMVRRARFLGVAALGLGLLAWAVWHWRSRAPGTAVGRPSATERDVASGRGHPADPARVVSVSTPRLSARRKTLRESVDPRRDGWSTEVFAERALGQLKAIGRQWSRPGGIEASRLAPVLAASAVCGPLRPAKLATVFEDSSLLVRRAADEAGGDSAGAYHGPTGLADALRELARPFGDAGRVDAHFKIVRLAADARAVRTVALFHAAGPGPRGPTEQHATWQCTWAIGAEGSLQLTALESRDYEEVVAKKTWFADRTAAVLGRNPSFHQQMAFGLNHWLGRIERVHKMQIYLRNGIAVGDVDGDGWDDLYVCQPGGLPNRLYVQTADGTAVDRSQRAGVDFLDTSASALLLDLDNDGDQDLVLALSGALLLLQNDGSGRFRLRATLRPADENLQSLAAADYDNDGDLDLYVCADFAASSARPEEPPIRFLYHDANDGGANVLLRNDIAGPAAGEWRFTDVTTQVGLDVNNRRHSLAAAWEDYDNDGDMDLYVANDYGQNCLYRNDGGRFVDVAANAGVIDSGSGMSACWADYDRDGFMDLYVGNMFSSAGSRIARQARFKPGTSAATRGTYVRFAKGNSLFENTGSGRFREVGAEAAVEMGRWAWSSLFADLNNDGWEDLVVANGYITTEDSGDL